MPKEDKEMAAKPVVEDRIYINMPKKKAPAKKTKAAPKKSAKKSTKK